MATNYYKALLTHPVHLTGAGVAAVVGGLTLGWVGVGCALVADALAVWMAPEFDTVKNALDKSVKSEGLETRRWYYLQALWNCQKPKGDSPFEGWLTAPKFKWSDLRCYRGDEDQFGTFTRLCGIVEGLKRLRGVREDAITEAQIAQIDEMINGWLTLLYTARNIEDTLRQLDRNALARALSELERFKESVGDDPTSKVILGERMRALQAKAATIPALEKRYSLILAQADTIVQQIETRNAQARSSGLAEASSLIDMGSFDSLTGGLDEVTAAAEVRGMLTGTDPDDPAAWDNLRKAVGTPASGTVSSRRRRTGNYGEEQ